MKITEFAVRGRVIASGKLYPKRQPMSASIVSQVSVSFSDFLK